MYTNSYAKSKFYKPYTVSYTKFKLTSKFFGTIYCNFIYMAQISKIAFIKFLVLIWNCFEFVVFPFCTKLGKCNGIWGTQKKTIHSNCLYSLIICHVVAYIVMTILIYYIPIGNSTYLCEYWCV